MTRSRMSRICEPPTPFLAAAEHVSCSAAVRSGQGAAPGFRAFRGRFSKIHASCASRNWVFHRATRASWGPESGSSRPIRPVSRCGYVTDRGCFGSHPGGPQACDLQEWRSRMPRICESHMRVAAASPTNVRTNELTKSLGHLSEITLEFRNARVRKPIGQLEFTGKGETA